MLLALLALVVSMQQTPVDGRRVPDGLAVNGHYGEEQSALDPGQPEEMYRDGFRWVRWGLHWFWVEPQRGQYDWSRMDPVMQRLDQAGIRSILILDDVVNAKYGLDSPRTPGAIQGFANCAVAIAKRYASSHPILEIGNEPDGPSWRPKSNPQEYATMALAAAKAIRAAVPDAIIAAPAVGPQNREFLTACFEVGLLDYIDEVSVHPYRMERPESVLADYKSLFNLIKSYHPSRPVGIFSTEWSYPLTYIGVDPERQAQYDLRVYLLGMLAGLDGTALYEWYDHPILPGQTQGHFGLREQDGADSLALSKLRSLVTELDGYTVTDSVIDGPQDSYILVFTKGGQHKVVGWTAIADPPTVEHIRDPDGDRSGVDVQFHGRSVHLTGMPTVLQ